MTDRTGIVVAGGYSRRFGDREKALVAPGDGDPMLVRVASALASEVDELVVNCRRDQRPAFREVLSSLSVTPRFAVDPVPGQGPAYGLLTALRFARGREAVVVGCDVPGLDAAVVSLLFDELPAGGAAVPTVSGVPQPLCAAYDVAAAREGCETALMRGKDAMSGVLEHLDVHVVPEAVVESVVDPASLRSVDTPADAQRAPRGRVD